MFIIYFILYLVIGYGAFSLVGIIVEKTVDQKTIDLAREITDDQMESNGLGWGKFLALELLAWPVMVFVSMYGWIKFINMNK